MKAGIHHPDMSRCLLSIPTKWCVLFAMPVSQLEQCVYSFRWQHIIYHPDTDDVYATLRDQVKPRWAKNRTKEAEMYHPANFIITQTRLKLYRRRGAVEGVSVEF